MPKTTNNEEIDYVDIQTNANHKKNITQQVTNDNKYINSLNAFNKNFLQTLVFGGIFSLLSKLGKTAKYMSILGKGPFLTAFATEVLDWAIATGNLVTAKNKNLGKWFDFFLSTTKATKVGIAVLGTVLGTIAAVVAHSLFLAVMGSMLVYNAGQLFYNIHKWRVTRNINTAEGRALKAQYSANIKKYALATGAGIGLVLGVALVIVFAPHILAVLPWPLWLSWLLPR